MKLYQHYSIYGFSNSYIVCNDEARSALIVDPAEINSSMISQIENNGYDLDAVLVTHNHIHHVRGIMTLLRIYGDCRVFASAARVSGLPSRTVRDGERFTAAGFEVEAIAMPGHSQDSMLFRLEGMVFTGDSLHAGLIGRTTSGMNAASLARRMLEKLPMLADTDIVLPGHGPPSTIGTERRYNLGLQPGYAEKLKSGYDFFV